MKLKNINNLLKEIAKKLEDDAKESFSGKVIFEINFSQGGVNSAKIKSEENMRF